MNPVRDAEKHNMRMAQRKKNSFRHEKFMMVYGSAEQCSLAVGYYSFNQIANLGVVITSGASYL